MKFWDSSALVPLFVEEPVSRSCRNLVRADPVQLVWLFSISEILAALCRRHREGVLRADDLRRTEGRLARAAARWVVTRLEVVLRVREEAARLLHRYPLRTADALQLAAALIAFDMRPLHRGFVCLDRDLREAAVAEGFDGIELGGV